MLLRETLTKVSLITTLAGTLAACGTLGPASVSGLRQVVGTDLLGAHGASDLDQRKIDRTIVRLCAGKVYSAKECSLHDQILR